ncbi:MAG TPA: arabinosyltransferase domain-containing protein, partial [Pseudonocardia sp.]|nr:arabinosyltransferase domain-containing protein [Pseudonocardia sp.]
ALTVTASPSGLLVVAAVPAFAGRIIRMLRAGRRAAPAGSGHGLAASPGTVDDASPGTVDNASPGTVDNASPGTADDVSRRTVADAPTATTGHGELLGRIALLAAVGAVGLTVVFADQTLSSLATATRWHTQFSPSLPWYLEVQRYRYLLGEYQDGNALKRVPVLLCLALLPVVALLLAGRGAVRAAALGAGPGGGPSAGRGGGLDGGGARDGLESVAAKVAGSVATGFALLWLTPSKWTLYFGSLAGLFAALITVAAVMLVRRAREGSLAMGSALAAGGVVALAAGLAFSGTNDWWQPALYAVPWAKGPIRPAGLPLDLPPLWAGAALAAAAVLWVIKGRPHARRSLLLAPAALTAATAATALAVLLVSFTAAPVRRPEASLALINLARLGGASGCGLADQIEVLPDVPGGALPAAPGERMPTESATGPGVGAGRPVPAASEPAASEPAASEPAASEPLAPAATPPEGFAPGAGWRTDRPPPDPPGVRASAQIWGSLVDGDPAHTGRLVSPWFALPALAPDQELALTVSGRTDGGNSLALEFGIHDFGAHAGPQVRSLGQRAPTDLPHSETPNTGRPDPPDPSVWRSVWLTRNRIPGGADRVRVVAVDGSSEPDGWLALTGPRLRSVVPLPGFLAANGPVLVNWPIGFLFPCVRNVVTVAHGIVGAPRAVLAPARRYDGLGGQSLDPAAAGDFAVLSGQGSLGSLGEVPTRVVGHPDLDWGSLRMAGYREAVRDGYAVRLTEITVPGWVGDKAQIVTRSDQSGAPSGHS